MEPSHVVHIVHTFLLNEIGSARTSLIVTIGPSASHHAETTSTIMFGQRVSLIRDRLCSVSGFDFMNMFHCVIPEGKMLVLFLFFVFAGHEDSKHA